MLKHKKRKNEVRRVIASLMHRKLVTANQSW